MTITNRVSLRSVESGITPIDDVPDAPTIGAATNVGTSRAYNNGSATVAYTAAATGGPVTTFTATSTPGSFTGTGASPITVTGLQSAISYTFAVSAANANGTLTSAASSSITATTVPQAPTIGSASAGATPSSQASVSFTAGATGGAAVSTFTATSSPGSLTGTSASSPITVSGLTTGTAYTFTVTATNANGTSAASAASNSYTPSDSYWISITGQGNSESDRAAGVAFDSSRNVYLVGTSSELNGDGYIAQFNSSGTRQWHRAKGDNSGDQLVGVAVDSSDNVYAFGLVNSGGQESAFFKFNTSGTTVANYTGSTSGNAYGRMTVDSSGNIYTSGRPTASSLAQISKYTNTPAHSWTRSLRIGGNSSSFNGVAVDSSSNVYAVGSCNDGSNDLGHIAKYDSSGTIQWQRKLTISGGYSPIRDCVVDSSGNIYVVGFHYTNPNERPFVAKYNSSGTIQWQQFFTNNDRYAQGYSIAIDSSSNIYIGGTMSIGGATSYVGFVAQFNSSGTLQWQRRINKGTDGSGGICQVNGIKIDSLGTMYLAISAGGNDQTNFDMILAKLPSDGTKTGAYTLGSGTVSYQSLSASVGAAGLTDAAGSATSEAAGIAFTSKNFQTNTPSLTTSTVGV